MMDGNGVYHWPDGRKYEGEYQMGHKQGYGTVYWKDGKKYTGYWKNNK